MDETEAFPLPTAGRPPRPGPRPRALGGAPDAAPRSRADPLSAARCAVPAVPALLVPRRRLLDRLTAGARGPLTLVDGPAGAGKTALAAHWVNAGLAPAATAWLTLEPDDAPGEFWACLIDSCRRHRLPLPAGIAAPAGADTVDRSLPAVLAEGLRAAPEPVVLVLDQVEAVTSREIAEGLHLMLERAAPRLHLVVLGRSEPLLPLHRYRLAGTVTEIRNADLRFTTEEAARLLGAHGLDIRPEGVRALVERTDGWAAGLRLAALALQRSDAPQECIEHFAADATTIADFLLTEVLEAQPQACRELLLRAAVTDRVHPDLADALTGHRDAAWTLARLARANAFVERIDATEWYRLHPLFAEILRAHLHHLRPGLEVRLRRRAARWFADRGLTLDAVGQAAAAGDWRFAADHLVDNLETGRFLTGAGPHRLERIFAAMPAEVTGTAPALIRAARKLAVHDAAGAGVCLRAADAGLAHTHASRPATRLTRALLGVLAARLTRDPVNARKAAARCERLLREVPPPLLEAHPEIRATQLYGLGSTELLAGRLDVAEEALAASAQACSPPAAASASARQVRCDALAWLALAQLYSGHLGRAELNARSSLAAARRAGLPAGRRPEPSLLVLAGVATEHRELAVARGYLERAAGAAGRSRDPDLAARAAVVAARLALAEGDAARALSAIGSVRALPGGDSLSGCSARLLALAESAAHLARHDTASALDALDSVATAACEPPEHSVARADALLAAGRARTAARLLDRVLGGDGAPAIAAQGLVRACVLRARVALCTGDADGARHLLARALDVARPERLRLPFAEAGPDVLTALRREPRFARDRGWLFAGPLGPGDGFGREPRPGCDGPSAAVERLSARERDVLVRAERMLSTAEIAADLYVSVNTVKTHLRSAFRKLGVSRRSDAVHLARRLGML